jgi:Protein of unknown function (DUF3040)
MTAPFASPPDRPDPLSSQERRILADIEDELRIAMPDLARSSDVEGWIPIRIGLPYSLSPRVQLACTLAILAFAVLLEPASALALVSLLFMMFGVPWILLNIINRRSEN